MIKQTVSRVFVAFVPKVVDEKLEKMNKDCELSSQLLSNYHQNLERVPEVSLANATHWALSSFFARAAYFREKKDTLKAAADATRYLELLNQSQRPANSSGEMKDKFLHFDTWGIMLLPLHAIDVLKNASFSIEQSARIFCAISLNSRIAASRNRVTDWDKALRDHKELRGRATVNTLMSYVRLFLQTNETYVALVVRPENQERLERLISQHTLNLEFLIAHLDIVSRPEFELDASGNELIPTWQRDWLLQLKQDTHEALKNCEEDLLCVQQFEFSEWRNESLRSFQEMLELRYQQLVLLGQRPVEDQVKSISTVPVASSTAATSSTVATVAPNTIATAQSSQINKSNKTVPASKPAQPVKAATQEKNEPIKAVSASKPAQSVKAATHQNKESKQPKPVKKDPVKKADVKPSEVVVPKESKKPKKQPQQLPAEPFDDSTFEVVVSKKARRQQKLVDMQTPATQSSESSTASVVNGSSRVTPSALAVTTAVDSQLKRNVEAESSSEVSKDSNPKTTSKAAIWNTQVRRRSHSFSSFLAEKEERSKTVISVERTFIHVRCDWK